MQPPPQPTFDPAQQGGRVEPPTRADLPVYTPAPERKSWVSGKPALALICGGLGLAAVLIGVAAAVTSGGGSSSPGSADHGRLMTPYVAQLYRDGYTDIKPGSNPNANYGCTKYAIGMPADAGGLGELVVQCPSSSDAYDLALSFNAGGGIDGNMARLSGDLVIVQGPPNNLLSQERNPQG